MSSTADLSYTTATPSLVRRTLQELVEDIGARTVCIAASKDPNAKVTLLLFQPGEPRPVYAAKVATTDEAARRVEAEAIRLLQLQGRPLGRLGDTVPRVLDIVEHRGRPALVTTAFAGTPMTTSYHAWRHTARPKVVTDDFRHAGQWLAAFQRQTAASAVALTAMVEGVSAALERRFGDDPQLLDDLHKLAEVETRLEGQWSARAAVHGDFWLGNILIDAEGVCGIVDWEVSRAADVPVHDLARFALTYSLYLDRHTRPGRPVAGHKGLRAGRWGAGIDHAVDGKGWYPQLVQGFLSEGLERLGVSSSCWRDVLLAELAVIAAEADHAGFAREHLLVFRRLAQRAGR